MSMNELTRTLVEVTGWNDEGESVEGSMHLGEVIGIDTEDQAIDYLRNRYWIDEVGEVRISRAKKGG